MRNNEIGFELKVDNSDKVKEEFNEATLRVLEAIGIHVEGEAKEELENDPRRIDTGLLRNSITYALSGESPKITSYHGDNPSKYGTEKMTPIGYYNGTAPDDTEDKKAVYIGTNVEYAAYVHEGTGGFFGLFKKMKPNRFLKNAIARNKQQLKKFAKEEYGKLN